MTNSEIKEKQQLQAAKKITQATLCEKKGKVKKAKQRSIQNRCQANRISE